MARGRMLNRSISEDRRIDVVIDEAGPWAGIFITWLIPYLDREGRVHGDPGVLAKICPRRREVSIEVRERALRTADELGLLCWYESDGDRYVWFPGFTKNQAGLRMAREAESRHPEPSKDELEKWKRRVDGRRRRDASTPQQLRLNSGVTPEPVRSSSATTPEEVRSSSGVTPAEWNRKERNGIEEKGAAEQLRPVAVTSPESEPRRPAAPGQISYSDLGSMISTWGWSVSPFTAKQRARAETMAPFSTDELRYAREQTESASGRPNAGLLLAIVARVREDGIPGDPSAERDWSDVTASMDEEIERETG